jgi:hypothetical protein
MYLTNPLLYSKPALISIFPTNNINTYTIPSLSSLPNNNYLIGSNNVRFFGNFIGFNNYIIQITITSSNYISINFQTPLTTTFLTFGISYNGGFTYHLIKNMNVISYTVINAQNTDYNNFNSFFINQNNNCSLIGTGFINNITSTRLKWSNNYYSIIFFPKNFNYISSTLIIFSAPNGTDIQIPIGAQYPYYLTLSISFNDGNDYVGTPVAYIDQCKLFFINIKINNHL